MRTRLYVAGIFGALALLAVTLVVVIAFGRHHPSPPLLADNPRPEIPGEILYLDEDNCFRRAAASGERQERLGCLPEQQFFQALYWLDDDTAGVVVYGANGHSLYEVDLATAAFSSTGTPFTFEGPLDPPLGASGGAYALDGTFAFFEERGELIILKDGVRTEVADFDVPRYQQPQVRLWSPDSQWMIVQYYPRHDARLELWIISRDGRVRGTLTRAAAIGPGAGAVAWRIGDQISRPLPN